MDNTVLMDKPELKEQKGQSFTPPKKKLIWLNIGFFTVTTLIGVVAAPFYIYHFGISLSEILLTLFFTLVTGLGVTVGYHRLFAHTTYKTNKFVRFMLLFFASGAFEQPALKWASQHRDHHRYVDTERDPYNIKKGFFYAHMGWLMFWDHTIDLNNAKDLQKDPLIMHQYRNYHIWAIGTGILLPLVLGALTGHLLGALILAVCFRITFVYHTTFFINSACHMFGKATYDIDTSARDHWMVAYLTNGEGYHNFHHRFPNDYRNGLRWYHWDASKWVIALLSRLGLAHSLKRASNFHILQARIAADNLRLQNGLVEVKEVHKQQVTELLSATYQNLKEHLHVWESKVKEYQETLKKQLSAHSQEVGAAALKKIEIAKQKFQSSHRQWADIIKIPPAEIHKFIPRLKIAV